MTKARSWESQGLEKRETLRQAQGRLWDTPRFFLCQRFEDGVNMLATRPNHNPPSAHMDTSTKRQRLRFTEAPRRRNTQTITPEARRTVSTGLLLFVDKRRLSKTSELFWRLRACMGHAPTAPRLSYSKLMLTASALRTSIADGRTDSSSNGSSLIFR